LFTFLSTIPENAEDDFQKCPFAVTAHYEQGFWKVTDIKGVHNHEASPCNSGHRKSKANFKEQKKKLGAKALGPPSAVQEAMNEGRQDWQKSDRSGARSLQRSAARDALQGRTPCQDMIADLEASGYVYNVITDNEDHILGFVFSFLFFF
jgi:predicted P-loop ATPase